MTRFHSSLQTGVQKQKRAKQRRAQSNTIEHGQGPARIGTDSDLRHRGGFCAKATSRRKGWARQGRARREKVGGFCCPVPPEPRLSLMQRQRAPHCHWHLWISPITAVQCRAKGRSLPRVSSLFRPHWVAKRTNPPEGTCFTKNGGGAGHCPRVHNAYFTHRLSP